MSCVLAAACVRGKDTDDDNHRDAHPFGFHGLLVAIAPHASRKPLWRI